MLHHSPTCSSVRATGQPIWPNEVRCLVQREAGRYHHADHWALRAFAVVRVVAQPTVTRPGVLGVPALVIPTSRLQTARSVLADVASRSLPCAGPVSEFTS